MGMFLSVQLLSQAAVLAVLAPMTRHSGNRMQNYFVAAHNLRLQEK
jgi:hypothetical protein